MIKLFEHNCVIEKVNEVGGTLLIELKSLDGFSFEYTAGQYLYLEIAPGDFRPFSIASRPSSDHLELHVRLMPDNPTLSAVQSIMVVGNKIRVRLAEGLCTLARRTTSKPIIFVAGGTGYAPFHGMLQELITQEVLVETHVFWGAANFDEIYLHDEIAEWAKNTQALHYYPVVQNPGDEDTVEVGLVHEAVLARIKNLNEYDIYIGGSAAMVGAVYKELVKAGANKDAIYSDMLDLGLCDMSSD